MMTMLFDLVICFVALSNIRCEEYNLFGDAGQAYSIQISLGHPHQKLSVIVDTGSTTLAIASYSRQDSNKFFHADNSSSIYDTGKVVQAKYSQGMWIGRLVTDYIQFPSMPNVPEIRTDVALITKSHKFFMNGSGWQGLLGLAYLPVGAWGDNVIVESWLDSLDRTLTKPMSFQLKLCGPQSPTNATHYGQFQMFEDQSQHVYNNTFRTPILRKRWYEVGVISIRVLTNTSTSESDIGDKKYEELYSDMCRTLNAEKSIVDSGTTNIRLPDTIFRQVVEQLKGAAQTSNMLILDEFWFRGETACWPVPQEWPLPWLAIDLLSSDADDQYFTLELPPQNYMRVVTANNSTGRSGTVSEFCYKLGLEAGNKQTVLGYTAMEGLQVIFNRSSGWIGWQSSNCGSNAKISGPYHVSTSLTHLCDLTKSVSDAAISIKAAQWTLCAISIIAFGVLVYLLAPCIKMLLIKRSMTSSPQISLSQAALVEQEST